MIPDPNYQAQISGQSLSQQNGLGFVDERQIMLVWLN
ncbi:hypothetical protein kac65v151_gp040 [Nodularia phage vB_NspS-kac65v151]|nr:hypothetical protein HWA92_gp038 [Nodularia phage vB_NpeS-2AV2]YP_009844643.1 hypothetical protein HWC12_gp040 [Nodularia phage vB_NspS-kac65v151]YP_009844853.1 hypothetical protein HWC13_gp044 [Nodularia phage vB_NspS-kac68v161]QBQ73278.1 hypothetical protein kac65v161_gp040 [Nodularia phage vB_NspS-kac65v161]ALY07490.1 hypothetical protein 2AV2_38 [Nodularia phage vB_NpeS-2AV2]QBQ73072.1 hypothetical protein kac65v151_gp040 [Nodularia phage vB_NspS-kac65v151]QBQ73694.1 hypothetical prote